LARFKKRKWGSEKPKPNDNEKKEEPDSTETNVEPTESEAQPEPTEPSSDAEVQKESNETFEDKSATKKLTDRLFWMRVVLAVIGGVIATFAFEDIADVEEKRWTSIGFMIMLFIATAIIAKTWRIRIQNKKKYVTTGIGSFVFIYLFVWIVSYTLVNSASSPSLIPFP
jgi:hypothetical protein